MLSLIMAIIRKTRFGVWLRNGQGRKCIRIFLLLVLHDRLKTNAELLRRHIPTGSGCTRSAASLENTLHVLRDCMATKRFWNVVIPAHSRQVFYSLNLRHWISTDLKNNWIFKKDVSWRCFFDIATWRLWHW